MKKLLGICYPASVIIFQENKVTWLLDEEQVVNQSRKFVDKVIKPDDGKRYFKLWEKATKQLTSVLEDLDRVNFKNLSNKELINKYKKLKNIYWNWWAFAMSVELVTTSIEPNLGEKLRSCYGDGEEKEFNRDFATLTSPLVLTFYRREQKDILNIYSFPKDQQKEALRKHQQKYYWILNSYYETRILDIDYFQGELSKITDAQYKKINQEISDFEKDITSRKNKIITERKIDKKTRLLVSLAERFSMLQDDRKMYNFRADHYLELFANEFAKRSKRKLIDIKNLLPDELLLIESISNGVINARKKCLVFECTEDKIKSFVGEDVVQIANQFLNVPQVEESMIHGVVASVGESFYFRGVAKIVLTIDEINKLEEGDVLITTMTSPDFVIGMKKAGAIITDVGGILSHAAIVSRELRKPCIVGTQIATKVVHDGDIVEIHSGRGTVKVIKIRRDR